MAVYSKQHLLEKLTKLKLEIGDLIAHVNVDLQRSNELIIVDYLKALANCIDTVYVPEMKKKHYLCEELDWLPA